MTRASFLPPVEKATQQPGDGGKAGELETRRKLDAQRIEFVSGIDYGSFDEEPIDWALFTESTILQVEDEWRYFRQMNLAYRQAHLLRERWGAGNIEASALCEFDRLLARGQRIRNGLLVVYSKLARSVARGFVSQRIPFEELESEALATAIRAVAMFNPDFGYRFSTYATHAIRRRLIRFVKKQLDGHEVNVDWQLCDLLESRRWTYEFEQAVRREIQQVDGLLTQLSPRERYVVRSRFGWGRDFSARTLQELADEQGVSRERIRQLEARALDKLRRFANRPATSHG